MEWQGYKLEGRWYSTGVKPGQLMLVHFDLAAMIEHHLMMNPEAVVIRTSWGEQSVPARSIDKKLSELVAAELKEPDK